MKKKYVYPKGKYKYDSNKYNITPKKKLGEEYGRYRAEEGRLHGTAKDFIKFKRSKIKQQEEANETE